MTTTETMPPVAHQLGKSAKAAVVLHARVVTGAGGGPEKTILNSPRYLAEHGFDSPCMFLHPPGDPGFESLRHRAAERGTEILSVPDGGPLDLSVLRNCLRICRERDVRIWHGHDYKSNAIGLLLRRFHKMALVTTVHGWVKHTRRTPLYYAVDKWCVKRYDAVLCVSHDLEEQCRAVGVPADRLQLIENGIECERYDRTISRENAKQYFGVPAGRFLLGAIGRLSEEKGFDLLISAVAELVAEGCDLGLLIAGEGDQQPALTAQIEQMGLGDRVKLVGQLTDPRDLYQSLDAFVLSSLREGLPNVILEAMASELPIVSTKVAGVPRALTDREDSLLVDCGEQTQLRDAIAECAASPDLRKTLAAAARRRVEREFSFARRMERVIDVYREVLS